MHVRYRAVQGIEISIALARLDRTRADANRIATQDDPDLLAEWRPYVASIRDEAARVAASSDTVVAAKSMARLGRACARCHQATGAQIAFAPAPEPAVDGKLGPEMARHQWAAAQMWDGLIGPNDDRWTAGARAFGDAPLAITAESGALGIADDVARTRALAARALVTGDQDARADLYGEMLATCAHCHATIRAP